MKKDQKWLKKTLVVVAEKVIEKNVNATCLGTLYQPKLPDGSERFKKIEKQSSNHS
ncbi:cyclic lactone autoinducer peptide [Anaeromicropila populeti]|uniref:Cyclic lactone autoinducer peptide n=1 Tax=Anaeromicropila populeti TaxID=37658 RepID=A0A1I6LDI9_9FIRM|nr:cyclic lactone autoinducer peptide [Anaeromicropila populeti]SFS01494.1 cyclic lactone autoinducer peptide [Anaeromicropila populeti]